MWNSLLNFLGKASGTNNNIFRGGHMTTASKLSAMSTKLQVGTAAVAVAAAAVLTPTVAHAAPTIAPFSENVGNSAQVLLESVVIPGTPGSNKTATAAAIPPATIIQVFVAGLVQGTQSAIRSGSQFIGSFVYAGLAFTGLVFSTFGLTQLGDGFTNAAWSVAQATHIGPYGTSA